MKKKLILLLSLCLFTSVSQAQFRYGVTLGYPLSLGVKGEYRLPIKGVKIEGTLYYEQENTTIFNFSKDYAAFIKFPLNIKGEVKINKQLGLYAEAGPYCDLRIYGYSPENFRWGFNVGIGVILMNQIELGCRYYYPGSKNYITDKKGFAFTSSFILK